VPGDAVRPAEGRARGGDTNEFDVSAWPIESGGGAAMWGNRSPRFFFLNARARFSDSTFFFNKKINNPIFFKKNESIQASSK
jgi:hypothetical protein